MKLLLLSTDKELHKLCREVLNELPQNHWELCVGEPAKPRPVSDLYIWDFQAGLEIPAELEQEKPRHLFLVQRKHLAGFREKCPHAEGSILLKPVNRATLATFLGQAVSRVDAEQPGSNPGSLRADRDAMLQCLIQSNLKLQEYDQDRTNFLARALHDFRTPLTALTGYCGLLLGEQLGPLEEDQKEVLRRMQHSTKRLSRMANAMFQLSVGRQVEQRPNLQKGDIRECIDQALHELMPFSEEKRLSISLDLRPCSEPLYFESSQVEQLIINLLENACKFTPKFGSIEIRGYPFFWERRLISMGSLGRSGERRARDSHGPNAFRVDIRDSGSGIPAEHLDKIFEEYTSYSGGQDRSGGGLGLAICRMILSRHQGRIWAESSAVGATFSFVLPFQPQNDSVLRNSANPLYAGVM